LRTRKASSWVKLCQVSDTCGHTLDTGVGWGLLQLTRSGQNVFARDVPDKCPKPRSLVTLSRHNPEQTPGHLPHDGAASVRIMPAIQFEHW
jgi:hypothetical protein